MKRRIIAAAVLGVLFPVHLSSKPPVKDDQQQIQKKLEDFLLNKRLVAKVAFPGYKTGIDVKTDGTWNQRWATRMIKEHGVGIEVGDTATVTAVKLSGDHIEIHLNGGGFGTAGDVFMSSEKTRQAREGAGGKVPGGSRINLHFAHSVGEEDVSDLGRLADYLDLVVDTSALRQDVMKQNLPAEFKEAASKGEIVVGMDKATVFAILGEPKAKNVDMTADPPLEKWQYELRDLKTRVVIFKEGKVTKVTDF
jgi:hypothetical protein